MFVGVFVEDVEVFCVYILFVCVVVDVGEGFVYVDDCVGNFEYWV